VDLRQFLRFVILCWRWRRAFDRKTSFSAFSSQAWPCGRYSGDSAIHCVCVEWRHMAEAMAASKGIYSEQKNVCVWNKTNGGMEAFYR